MSYALFLGCKIPYFVPQYETALRRVMAELKMELVDMEFNCCGYPMRHLYIDSYLLAATQALAKAGRSGLPMLTPCSCCFGSFKRAIHLLETSRPRRESVIQTLGKETLDIALGVNVRHLLSALYLDVGLETLRDKVVRPLKGLQTAVMYGCHVLRPSRVTGFDNPYHPTITDSLVEVTGADSLDWPGRLSCCGAPLRNFNDDISRAMIEGRLTESADAGASVLCVSCPHTRMQADWALETSPGLARGGFVSEVVVYPQLLGLSLGIDAGELGWSAAPDWAPQT